MSRQNKFFVILVILVMLCNCIFPACADPEELPEKSDEFIAGDILPDTDGQEEKTTVVATGEKNEEETDRVCFGGGTLFEQAACRPSEP